ncbi:hypothetical protein AMTRI_Chr13g84650 [Amborella trichopoda]
MKESSHEGIDTSQGKPQPISNINACTAIVDSVRTTLGPRGMDKLVHDDKGNTTISNDEATIMKLLDIVHPSAKTLVAIANSQDSEVGDGTTTVPYIEDGVHPRNLIRSYRTTSYLAINKIKELAVSIEGRSFKEKKDLMQKCAATTLSSTLIGGEKESFASMVVDAEMAIGEDDRLNLIGVKKDQAQYQSIVDYEWTIIYDKLDKCVKSGAKIVLSLLCRSRYLCVGRVTEEDLQRVAAATGGTVQTFVNNIIDEVLGCYELFEEKQVGNERFNIFSGCPTSGQTATIVLRGGADQFIEEAERSLHYAIMIVRTALRTSTVVAGGGAIDMEISRYLRQHARTIARKSQLFINSYAKALEIIPRQLCDKAGFDATDVLNKLRQKHPLPSGEGARYGVDINTGGITYTFANFVWEPAVTVKNPKSESAQGEAAASAMGRGLILTKFAGALFPILSGFFIVKQLCSFPKKPCWVFLALSFVFASGTLSLLGRPMP